MKANRPLALFLGFIALSLIGLSLVPGSGLAYMGAALGGLFGAIAVVQWHGPRKR